VDRAAHVVPVALHSTLQQEKRPNRDPINRGSADFVSSMPTSERSRQQEHAESYDLQ
jgi:hypothetical protein